ERRRVTPAEIVLIAGREKRARLVYWHGDAGDEADLRDLVDEDAVLGQFGAHGVDKGELRAEFLQPLFQLGLALQHLFAARGAPRVHASERVDQFAEHGGGVADQ